MTEKLKNIVPVRMDDELLERLQKEADSRKRPLSWLIREFILDGLNNNRRK